MHTELTYIAQTHLERYKQDSRFAAMRQKVQLKYIALVFSG